MLPPPHRRALEIACDRLGDHVSWAVSGSVALALHGIAVSCADLDIVTGADTASDVERLLAGATIEPVRPRARDRVRGNLGRTRLAGVEIEILGDIQNLLPGGTWTAPPRLDAEIEHVPLQDRAVPVIGLGELRDAYAATGRDDKVTLIDEFIARDI